MRWTRVVCIAGPTADSVDIILGYDACVSQLARMLTAVVADAELAAQ